MRKSLGTTLVVLTAILIVPTAQAAEPTLGERIIAQENATQIHDRPVPPPAAVDRIVAQERGRHGDARVFGHSGAEPVLVAGEPDGFDFRDAGIGGAAALAAALLAAAAVGLSSGHRRRRATGAVSA